LQRGPFIPNKKYLNLGKNKLNPKISDGKPVTKGTRIEDGRYPSIFACMFVDKYDHIRDIL